MNNLEKNLTDWGRTKQTLPDNHQLMKSTALAKLSLARPGSHRPSNFKFPWLSLAFTGLAAAVLIIGSVSHSPLMPMSDFSQTATTRSVTQNQVLNAAPHAGSNSAAKSYPSPAPSAAMPMRQNAALQENIAADGSSDQRYYPPIVPPDTGAVPTKDNREFLHTDYASSIKTRDVQNLSAQLTTVIRGFDGRVDATNNSHDAGYISFVLPADKLETFKTQVKNLAGAKLYLETQSAENLLPQKVAIENQQTDTQKTLDQLNTSLTQLNQTHSQTIASLQGQINTATRTLKSLQNEPPSTLARAYEIMNQEQDLQMQIKNLQNRLAQENTDYQNQSDDLNSQIGDQQIALSQLSQQNSKLIDTVNTVNGTISLSYINLWDLWNIYVPNLWLVIVLVVGAGIAYFFRRPKMMVP